MKAKRVFEKFEEGTDPIDDMNIGKVVCPYCKGHGYTDEHDPLCYDPRTGEHDCYGCPIQVPYDYCNGTGEILKKDIARHQAEEQNWDDLPF